MKYNNFDFIRLCLAGIVFFVHTYDLTLSNNFVLFSYLSSDFAVKCFFVLSGYFIFKSYYADSRIYFYLKKRLCRIYPAYVFTVLFFSFALYFESDVKDQYFSFAWIKYVAANAIFMNFLAPSLPGVFANHVTNAVNGALWTLKIEVAFYLFVPLAFFIMRYVNKFLVLFCFYFLSVIYVFFCLNKWGADSVLAHQFPGQLRFFMVGALWFFVEANLLKLRYLLALSLFTFVSVFISYQWFEPFIYLLPLVFFGRLVKLPNLSMLGDISYGLYIFHFPMIQIFYDLLLGNYPYIAFGFLSIAVFLLSYFSWNLIERKFLSTSNHFSRS